MNRQVYPKCNCQRCHAEKKRRKDARRRATHDDARASERRTTSDERGNRRTDASTTKREGTNTITHEEKFYDAVDEDAVPSQTMKAPTTTTETKKIPTPRAVQKTPGMGTKDETELKQLGFVRDAACVGADFVKARASFAIGAYETARDATALKVRA